MKVLVYAIHGIMNGGTTPLWPAKFAAWASEAAPELRVLSRHYFDLPLPRLNWFKNRYVARAVANEIELFLGAHWEGKDSEGAVREVELPSVWFLAHSNGAVIALMAAQRLIANGFKVGGLILTGAACEADVDRNGVRRWVEEGGVGAAIAYASQDDLVLDGDPRVEKAWWRRVKDWAWGKAMWPYGCLGRTGWMRGGRAYYDQGRDSGPKIFDRWFRGGHSAYFTDTMLPVTFERVVEDIRSVERATKETNAC